MRPGPLHPPSHRSTTLALLGSLTLLACNDGPDDTPFDSPVMTTTGAGSTGQPPATTGGETTAVVDESGDGITKLDVSFEDVPPVDPGCTPMDADPDRVDTCTDQAPPDSFDAQVQWSWNNGESYHTPLVINLTDDNGNGEIDICDTPDVVVLTGTAFGTITVLDNDGAAEILVVSNVNFEGQQLTPTLQVIGDSQDRWIQARRIWNQHTYHVTNVNEDGTIPDYEPPSWTLLNTYRTNSQIEGGGLCIPPVG